MDWLISFCIEELGTLALEEGIRVASESRYPRWMRLSIALIISSFVAVVIAGILLLGIHILLRGNETGLIPILLSLVLIYGIYRKIKEFQTQKNTYTYK